MDRDQAIAAGEAVYQENGQWWFFDETGDSYGPYATRDIAQAQLRDYCELVLGEASSAP